MYQDESCVVTSYQVLEFLVQLLSVNANFVLLLCPDHHCGVGASQPVRIYLPGAMGRAAGSAVLSYLLGGAGN